MPDWQKLVTRRLADLPLDDREKAEVIGELAGHLQETYDAACRDDLDESEAVHRTLSQVRDWQELQRRIHAVKEGAMNARTSRLWIPTLVTFALSLIMDIGVGFLGLNPGPLSLQPHHGMYIVSEYTVWLIVLPFVGALGARLSMRAGGTLRDVVISGVSPALGWLIIVLLVLSVASSREYGLQAATAPFGPFVLITVLVLIPGACLVVGVLAYLATERWHSKVAG